MRCYCYLFGTINALVKTSVTLVLFFVKVDGNLLDLKCGRLLYSNSLRVISLGAGTRNLFNLKKFYFGYEKNLQKNTKTGFLSKFSFHISFLC